jgi:uncharacterized protein (DUF934 family)
MQIIKDKQLIANDWTFIDNDSAISAEGNITVTLERWLKEQPELLKRNGKIGLRLASSDAINSLAGHVTGLALIELNFPGFGDGRLFSHAYLLRSRFDYQGEIRAIGRFLADQVFYLTRVGVNAFQFEDQQQIPLALASMSDFTVKYQASVL